MSTLCDYEVHVKGSKKACLMVYETMASYGVKKLVEEGQEGDSYFTVLTGDCRGIVTEGMIDQMDPIDVNKMKDDDIRSNGPYYWNYSLRAKSEALQCEILLRYWSKELVADRFVQYVNGEVLKELEVPYIQGTKNIFDWDAMEYTEHAVLPEKEAEEEEVSEDEDSEDNEPEEKEDVEEEEGPKSFKEAFAEMKESLEKEEAEEASAEEEAEAEEVAEEVAEEAPAEEEAEAEEAPAEEETEAEEVAEEVEEAPAEEEAEAEEAPAEEEAEAEEVVEEVAEEVPAEEEAEAEEVAEEVAEEAPVEEEEKAEESPAAAEAEEEDNSPGDWYKWTFNNGKKISGYGWTIALPDEFSANDGSIFEVVPKGYESEEDKTAIPVRILAGGADSSNEMDDRWMIHPYARAGVAARIGLRKTKKEVFSGDSVPELMAFGWADSVAWVSIRTSEDGKVTAFCTIYHGNADQTIRIQTVKILPNQKLALKQSIKNWIQSIEFEIPNEDCPKETLFEKEECYTELMEKNSTERFSFAVEEAQKECNSAVDDMLEMMSYMDDNGLCKEEMASELKSLLQQGIEVKEFFLKKADALIKRLQENGADREIILQMLENLHELDDDCTDISLDEEEIRVEVPQDVKDIRIGWRKIEAGMDGSKPMEPTKAYTAQPYEPEPYEAEYFGYTPEEIEAAKSEKEEPVEEKAVEEQPVETEPAAETVIIASDSQPEEKSPAAFDFYEKENGEDDMDMDWDTKYMKRERKILERKVAMMEMDLSDDKNMSAEKRQQLRDEINKVTGQLRDLCKKIGD